uniref:Uncharacterized protein n=1 Tax=Rhizophora mucronata TaxID=61149 RepID=A0A2P2PBK5_RHIMU
MQSIPIECLSYTANTITAQKRKKTAREFSRS